MDTVPEWHKRNLVTLLQSLPSTDIDSVKWLYSYYKTSQAIAIEYLEMIISHKTSQSDLKYFVSSNSNHRCSDMCAVTTTVHLCCLWPTNLTLYKSTYTSIR